MDQIAGWTEDAGWTELLPDEPKNTEMGRRMDQSTRRMDRVCCRMDRDFRRMDRIISVRQLPDGPSFHILLNFDTRLEQTTTCRMDRAPDGPKAEAQGSWEGEATSTFP